MREIEFRGMDINREWYYGSLIIMNANDDTKRYFISIPDWSSTEPGFIQKFKVLPLTIGQYTGLKDKVGTRIFEGDEVLSDDGDKYTVVFANGAYRAAGPRKDTLSHSHSLLFQNKTSDEDLCGVSDLKVIGNIHENKEES